MTAKEAKELLSGPCATSKAKAHINPSFTQDVAVGIIRAHVDTLPDEYVLQNWEERRVLQVTQNRCRVKL